MIPRNLLLLLLLCSAAFGVAAATLTVDGVEFAYRLAAGSPLVLRRQSWSFSADETGRAATR